MIQCKDACPIKLDGESEENQVKLIPHEQIQMFGVPLGDDVVSGFVEGKVLSRYCKPTSRFRRYSSSHLSIAIEFQHSSRSTFYAHGNSKLLSLME